MQYFLLGASGAIELVLEVALVVEGLRLRLRQISGEYEPLVEETEAESDLDTPDLEVIGLPLAVLQIKDSRGPVTPSAFKREARIPWPLHERWT